MINQSIAAVLNQMGDLLELCDDNPFRIRAFRRAAQVIESHPADLGSLSRKDLLAIPGIGQGMADKIEEFAKTGRIQECEKLKQKFPEGILAVMNLPGLGAKRAAVLYRELKIDSLAKLSKAATSGVLKDVKGFGEKMQEAILKNIGYAEEASKRVLILEAQAHAAEMHSYLIKSPHIERLELAGSARRWKETVGDLDFVCVSRNASKVMSHFLGFPGKSRVLAHGATKSSMVLANGLQCDLRVMEAASFGAALVYFTGSKQHNVRLRELAQRKGYTLNEYGLYRVSDKEKKKPVAGRTEEEVYQALGLQWIPPELREDRGEIDAAVKNQLPHLVTEEDILGDFHNHTTLSDGRNTLEEMVDAAQARGWKWFFSADHSPSLKIASGLPVPALRTKMNRVRKLNSERKDIRVFCSSEVDILADGALDYPDDVLAELDAVVASVHSRFKEPEEKMTERICRAVRNKHTDILGHISGRRIGLREGYAINYEKIFQATKETQTALEINGQPQRQELSDVGVKRAIELGIPLAVNTDAHSTQELRFMQVAVHIARRGWAEPRHIINTMPIDSLTEWLRH